MAESTVTIKIDIDAQTAGIERVRQRLIALAAQAETLDDRFKDIADRSDRLNRNFIDLDKEIKRKEKDFGRLTKGVDKTSNSFDKAGKKARETGGLLQLLAGGVKKLTMLLMKGFAVSLALTAASLVSINLLFKAGAWLSKAWGASVTFAMKSVAAAGATAVSVLAALAAAQKQYIAATQASRYGGGLAGLKASSTALRSLTANTNLAVFGAEALQGAFAAISQSTKMTGGLASALEAMGDFAAAAADPKKALAAAGQFLGQLASKGKLTSEIIAAAGEIGPEFEKAVKDAQKRGITSSDAFLKALVGGDLSDAVAGQLDIINMTLFGTAKRNFQIIKEDFADFGQPLLKPVTETFERIARTFRVTLMSISGVTREFAEGPLLGNLEKFVSRSGLWITRVFNEYLPQVEGMLSGVRNWFRQIGDGWDRLVDRLRPLVEGGQILIDTFKPALRGIFGGFGQGLYDFNALLKQNKEEFLAFGDALGNLFGAVGRLFGQMKEDFVKLLPTITKVIDFFTSLLNAVTDTLGAIGKLGQLGSAANLGLLGMLFVAGKGGGPAGVGASIQSRMGRGGPGQAGLPPVAGTAGGGLGTMTPQMMTASVVNITAATVRLQTGGRGGAAGAGGKGTKIDDGPIVVPPGGPGGPAGGQPGRFRQMMSRIGSNPYALMMAAAMLPAAGGMLENIGLAGAGGAGTLLGGGMMMKSMNLGGANVLPYAGMAAGGYVAGGMASKLILGTEFGKGLGSKTHSGVGFGAGAAAGATVGAIVGSAIPIIGTAVGAGVGAAIGGVAGGISGYIQSGKFKSQAKQSATDFVGGYEERIKQKIESGDVVGAKNLLMEMDRMSEAQSKNSAHFDSFNDQFDKLSKELKNDAEPAIKKYNSNIELLSKYTGLSSYKIKELSDELGINLAGSIENVGQVVAALQGLPFFKNVSELEAFISQTVGGGLLSAFQKPQIIAKSKEAVDEAGRTVREKAQAGTATMADIGGLLTSSFQYDMAIGLSPLQSLEKLTRAYGPGGAMYKQGKDLGGLESMLGPMFISLFSDAATSLAKSEEFKGIANDIAVQAQGKLGTTETIQKALVSSMAGKTGEEQLDILRKFSQFSLDVKGSGQFFKQNPLPGPYKNVPDVAGMQGFLASIGVNLDPVKDIPTDVASQTAATVQSTLQTVYNTVRQIAGRFLGNMPTNPLTGGVPTGGFTPRQPRSSGEGDTTSSRLLSTLASHSMFNSMIPGKRMITSSLRNTNLGSLGSDHATGNAYDLVGQNLVSYANMVNQSGGFAEFHGGIQDRHLHVVPGNGPVGDTMSPMPSLAATSQAQSTQNSYQIIVNPPVGASPQDIAEAVMQRIYREQRSARERQ